MLTIGQPGLLEMIAGGAPLSEILEAVVSLMEAQAPEMLCSILPIDESATRLTRGRFPLA